MRPPQMALCWAALPLLLLRLRLPQILLQTWLMLRLPQRKYLRSMI
jgi:hypothetical protein